jgi:hypothetical protein
MSQNARLLLTGSHAQNPARTLPLPIIVLNQDVEHGSPSVLNMTKDGPGRLTIVSQFSNSGRCKTLAISEAPRKKRGNCIPWGFHGHKIVKNARLIEPRRIRMGIQKDKVQLNQTIEECPQGGSVGAFRRLRVERSANTKHYPLRAHLRFPYFTSTLSNALSCKLPLF